MRKLYLLITLSCALLLNTRLLAQCGVTISTSTNTTQINCTNPTITLTAIPSGTGTGKLSYSWNNGDTGVSIDIYTGGTYIITMHSGKGADQCTSSSSIIISEDKTKPDVLALAFPATICAGDSTTLVALGANTYVWTVNGAKLSDSATFPDAPKRTTNYLVTGTGLNGCTEKDSIVVAIDSLRVATGPEIIKSKVKCAGDSISLKITVKGGSPLAYQWYINTAKKNSGGKEIPGATSDSSVVKSTPGTNYYYCVVTGRCGLIRSTFSDSVTLAGPVVFTVQPLPYEKNICLGSTADSLKVEVAKNIIDDYRWYSIDSSYSDTTLVAEGKDSNFYVPSTDAVGTKYYYCLVTSSCNTDTSNISGAINIKPLPKATIMAITGIICQGSDEQIKFKGSLGTAPYTFKYKFDTSFKTVSSAGANDETVISRHDTAGTYAYKLNSVSDFFGCKQTLKDDPKVLIVNSLPSASIDPTTITVCKNTPAAITFNGKNGTSPYTFSYNVNGLSDSTIISAGDSQVLSILDTTTGIFNYNLMSVSDNNGCTQTQSGTAVVNVNRLPAASISVVGANSLCQGSNGRILFTGSNGTIPYTFKYNVNGSPDSIPTKGISDHITLNKTINEAETFYLNSVTDGNGCMPQSPIDSAVVLSVNPLPSASIFASATTVCQNSTSPLITFLGSHGTAPYIFSYNINGNGADSIIISKKDSGSVYVPTDSILNFTYNLASVSDSKGCAQSLTKSITVNVGNKPNLDSTKTISICDGSAINYLAHISEPVTSFAWVRSFLTGISNPAETDTINNVSGTVSIIDGGLNNFTDSAINVPYYITLSTGPDCVVKDSLVVTVNPKPLIDPDSIYDRTYCNGAAVLDGIRFKSETPNASFTWWSDKLIGFGDNGSNTIPGFIASNPGTQPLVATETVTVSDNLNCPGDTMTFTITVNPSAVTPAFKWLDLNNNTLCTGAHNISFNVIAPADSTTYLWSAIPPGNSKVSIKDFNDANTVISFDEAGTYTLNVAATNQVGGCGISNAQTVNVTNTTGIDERKIILKQPGNLLFYPDNSMDRLTGYQWGYDSVINAGTGSGQDYSFGPPTAIQGQVYQFFTPDSLFLDNQNNLDTTKYKYWVLLQKAGCYTKAYYNGPYADLAVQAPPLEDNTIRLSVMPNPNNGIFQIALKGNIYGNINAKIYNAMGQLVFTKQFTKTTAGMYESINKINLSNGLYYLIVNSSDMKKAVTRFIIQH